MAAPKEETQTSSADDDNSGPCEAVAPLRVVSGDMDEARVDTKNAEEGGVSASFSADKQDGVGFKLPGLPLPCKSSAQRVHPPASSNVLEKRPQNDEPEESDVPQSQSGKEGFAFPMPPSAANSNTGRDHKNSGPESKAEHSSGTPGGVQARAPVSAEKQVREKSPDEKLTKAPPLPYREPPWSGVPPEEYHLDVLKGGAIIATIPLSDKGYHVFGRLETCDVALEHPSLSRHHLVLQYRLTGDSEHDPGFYLYDLGSTHGSWFNKQQMKGRVYYRMRVGHMFKLGGSSRMYILQGPSEDQEAESELSVKELKELRQQQLAQLEEQRRRKQEEAESETSREEEKGITWGMDYEDADDVDTTGDNPFAIMTQDEKEASYIKDPKKTLRGYFEREGYDLEYHVEEKESGFSKQFVCKVELPIDDASGRPIVAEAAVQGKKKEAVAACALEACRILDAQGVLRQATHESRKRKAKNWKEDDYYDSDEDTFLDRTGEIEKKRVMRMKKAGVIKEKAQTYDSLKSQLSEVETEVEKVEEEMSAVSKSGATSVVEDDSLDAFMESIKSGKTLDKTWRARLKLRLIELRKEQARLTRLVEIAKPASMPSLQKPSMPASFAALSKKLPMFGAMKGKAGLKPKMKIVVPSRIAVPLSVTSHRQTEKQADIEVEEDEPQDVVSPPATTSSSNYTVVASPDRPITSSPGTEATSSNAEHEPNCPGVRSDLPLPSAPRLVPAPPPETRKRHHQGRADGEGKASPLATVSTDEERRPSGESKTDLLKRAKKVKTTKKALQEREMEEADDKEDFTDWTPPIGQTGDGRTHLNAKFGY